MPRPATALAALTLFTFLVHGYHPYAEDGGLYVAGIEHLLNPALFPAYTPFVTEHLRFSLFAPWVAWLTRASHLPLPVVLLLLYLASIAMTLAAGFALASRVTRSTPGRLGAATLLASLFTLPVAGTSLMLADPYLTARSFTLPLTLFALSLTLDLRPLDLRPLDLRPLDQDPATSGRPLPGSTPSSLRPSLPQDPPQRVARPRVHTAGWLLLTLVAALVLHPLMAAYAGAAVVVLLAAQIPADGRRWVAYTALALAALLAALTLQLKAPPESRVYVQAAFTRYYWFPARWQWYEQFGLIAPLAVLWLLGRGRPNAARATLLHATITLAAIALLVALLFANPHLETHLVARLQPLRAFVVVYAVMLLLLGVWLGETVLRTEAVRWTILIAALGALMFFVQRRTYPASEHLELPGRQPTNAWVQAFLWARGHTPVDAVFALPAHYITADGEDAQHFRAIAQRSALPDYSKDGGEASITPSLTPDWSRAVQAQLHLDTLTDARRLETLKPLGATWLLLPTDATTALPCPYTNPSVKLCRLSR